MLVAPVISAVDRSSGNWREKIGMVTDGYYRLPTVTMGDREVTVMLLSGYARTKGMRRYVEKLKG